MATPEARRMRWQAATRPVRTTKGTGTTMLICAPGTIRYGMDVGTTADRWQLYPEWERALRAIAAKGRSHSGVARTIEAYAVWNSHRHEGFRAHRAPERGGLGAGRPRVDRRAGGGRGGGRAAGTAAGGDQGVVLLALPLARGAARGRPGALGAGRAGGGVRPARGDPGSGAAAALAVHPGRDRGALAHRLQRAVEGAGPSGGASGDRAGVRAPPGVPHRVVPPGRTQPQRCPAPRAPGLRRLRRLPAAQPATAAAAPATR